MADIRLETVKRQDDPPLSLGDPLEASGVGEREGEQFVVAFEQVRDCPRGDGDPAAEQVLVDFRETTVLRIAQRPDPGDDIEANLMLGQGEPSLCFGPVRALNLGTGAVKTAPNLQGES